MGNPDERLRRQACNKRMHRLERVGFGKAFGPSKLCFVKVWSLSKLVIMTEKTGPHLLKSRLLGRISVPFRSLTNYIPGWEKYLGKKKAAEV